MTPESNGPLLFLLVVPDDDRASIGTVLAPVGLSRYDSVLNLNIQAALQGGFGRVVVVASEVAYDSVQDHVYQSLSTTIRSDVVSFVRAGPTYRDALRSALELRESARETSPFAFGRADELHPEGSFRALVASMAQPQRRLTLVTVPVRTTLAGAEPVRRTLCSRSWAGVLTAIDEGWVRRDGDGRFLFGEGPDSVPLAGDEPVASDLWAATDSAVPDLVAIIEGREGGNAARPLHECFARSVWGVHLLECPDGCLFLADPSNMDVRRAVSDMGFGQLDPDVPGSGTRLPITVVKDWSHCERRVFWEGLLASQRVRGVGPRDVRLTAPAEQLLRPGSDAYGPFAAREFASARVVIVNWDAANGDPEFGADATMRWFEHRRLEILQWVAEGGILIVEGQATLSIPTQRAYSSILGPTEVQVCGPEDPLRWDRQRDRNGGTCALTRHARHSELFREVPPELRGFERGFAEMFPWPGSEILKRVLRDERFELYRGYFAWRPLHRTSLDWIPLVRTKGRRLRHGRFNHATLLVARHGEGAIFASTMFLAGADQHDLVAALLSSYGQTEHLPKRKPAVVWISNQLRTNLVPVLVTGAAGLAVTAMKVTGVFRDLTRGLIVIVGIAFVGVAAKAAKGLWRLGREAMGR